MGTLEASGDMETGQVASRATPIPGPTLEQGARKAMAKQGARASMAVLGTRGRPWRIRRHRGPWRVAPTKKKYCGDRIPGGTREVQTLRGARAARTLGGARAAQTLGGARAAQTLGGAVEERTQELGSNSYLHMPPAIPGENERLWVGLWWPAALIPRKRQAG